MMRTSASKLLNLVEDREMVSILSAGESRPIVRKVLLGDGTMIAAHGFKALLSLKH